MIRVNHNYVVDVDDMNFIAKEDKHKSSTDKQGNKRDIYVTLGYYGTLEGALGKIRDDMIKKKLADDEVSLKEAIDIIKQANEEFKEMLV